jgi:predicted transposase/invertase (TIGR01784 family)
MAKSKAVKDKLTRYINLLTDFGFKRIFGEEANKDLLVDFLNAVLNIEGGIKKLEYGNPERQGRVKKDRKAVFDLYCTTGKGERIIVEMQKVPQTFYADRSLYYASFLIQEQGKRSKWNFELTSVYSVNIVMS